MTGLILAAKNGNTDVVKILLEHGADISAKDNNGTLVVYTPNFLFIYICMYPSIYLFTIYLSINVIVSLLHHNSMHLKF